MEDSTNRRLQLADLCESGVIEQDDDVILFIYCDEVYNKSDDNPKKSEAEIIIGKQRNSSTGKVKLTYQKEWSTFLPHAKRDDDYEQQGV